MNKEIKSTDIVEVSKAPPRYIIDKDVPIPERDLRAPRRPTIYPFDKMEVGQSFFVPLSEFPGITNAKLSRRLVSAVNSWRERRGVKWTFRYRLAATVENGVEGVRLWRLEDEAN